MPRLATRFVNLYVLPAGARYFSLCCFDHLGLIQTPRLTLPSPRPRTNCNISSSFTSEAAATTLPAELRRTACPRVSLLTSLLASVVRKSFATITLFIFYSKFDCCLTALKLSSLRTRRISLTTLSMKSGVTSISDIWLISILKRRGFLIYEILTASTQKSSP